MPGGSKVVDVHGLAVASDWRALHQFPSLPRAAASDADVTLRLAPPGTDLVGARRQTAASRPEPGAPPAAVFRDITGVVIRFEGVLDVMVATTGDAVTVAPHDRADPYVLMDLLLGLPFAYILWRRGHLPLHASAVAFDGACAALVAPSHTGKSTLAAGCVGRGATLVADDLLALSVARPEDARHRDDSGVRARPGMATIRLSGASAHAVGRGELPPLRPTRPGWKHWQAVSAAKEPVSMSALLLLTRGDVDEPSCRSLAPSKALIALCAHVYGFTMFDRAERRHALRALAAVVEGCPVAQLAVPDDLDDVGRATDLVKALARGALRAD